MGCTTSSGPMDAQTMLEKQRELMLQRQKEFETKRQQQQQQGQPQNGRSGHSSPEVLLSGMRPPVMPGVPKAVNKNGSAPPSPATPVRDTSSAKPVGSSFKLDEAPPSPQAEKRQPLKVEQLKPVTANDNVPDSPEVVDPNTVTKHTLDNSDLLARRSKNIHDLSMYGKNVTRRPSFNPRPSESPFTAEMQAMMKAGHESMMAAELEKKQQRVHADIALTDTEMVGKPSLDIPKFEEGEQEKEKLKTTATHERRKGSKEEIIDEEVGENDDEDLETSNGVKTELRPKKKQSDEDFDFNVDEAKKKADAERLESQDTVPDDASAAKYVAKDNVDRKSKNVHDLGQYFNRRASFIPNEPGQQARRMSFQPETLNRRHSHLPSPAPT